jgi:hypothetical protein
MDDQEEIFNEKKKVELKEHLVKKERERSANFFENRSQIAYSTFTAPKYGDESFDATNVLSDKTDEEIKPEFRDDVS